jgi:hypothetical protein
LKLIQLNGKPEKLLASGTQDKDKNNTHNTICVGNHYTQINTNNILIELVDLGLDWDFYIEVNSTEQDIQHKTELRYLILAFAVVGSITFLFGLIGLRYDARKDYKHLTFSTALSMISTWLEDVPQIVHFIILFKQLVFLEYDLLSLKRNCQTDIIICTNASPIAIPAFAICTFDINSDDQIAIITARTIWGTSSSHVDIIDSAVERFISLKSLHSTRYTGFI